MRMQRLRQLLVHLRLVRRAAPPRRTAPSTAARAPRCPCPRTRTGRPPAPSRPALSPARWATSSRSSRSAGRQLPVPRSGSASLAPPAAPTTWRTAPGGPQPASTTGAAAPGERCGRLEEQLAEPLGVARQAADRLEGGHQVVRGRVRLRRVREPLVGQPGLPARARPCPTRSGSSRSRARASRSGKASSTPVTAAPREAAISRASPEPQPRPSSRVPGPLRVARTRPRRAAPASAPGSPTSHARVHTQVRTAGCRRPGCGRCCRTSVGVIESAPIRRELSQ